MCDKRFHVQSAGVFFLLVLLVGSPLFVLSDNLNRDFTYRYVPDFTKPSEVHRVTHEVQEKMAERRRGIYVSSSQELLGWLSAQLGKKVRRFFIDIACDNRVKLVLECDDGEYVSSRDFLEGRMSDTSFYWGPPDRGVAARYGVLQDYLPVAFCPQKRPETFVMKKWSGTLDVGKVRLVPSLIRFCEGCEQGEDLFNLVCETESAARLARKRSLDEESAIVVAYYVRELNRKAERNSEKVQAGNESPARYWVLTSTGTFWIFQSDVSSRFQWMPYLSCAWWSEFEGNVGVLGGNVLLHDVRRDEIIVIDTVFGLSQSLDSRIITPGYFRHKIPGKVETLGEQLDRSIARELRKPEEMFLKSRYRRLKDTPENKQLRDGLVQAVKHQRMDSKND